MIYLPSFMMDVRGGMGSASWVSMTTVSLI